MDVWQWGAGSEEAWRCMVCIKTARDACHWKPYQPARAAGAATPELIALTASLMGLLQSSLLTVSRSSWLIPGTPALGITPCAHPHPPVCPCRRPQEARQGADSYLFDLCHFVGMHADPTTSDTKRGRLPPLPAGVDPEEGEHLVVDALRHGESAALREGAAWGRSVGAQRTGGCPGVLGGKRAPGYGRVLGHGEPPKGSCPGVVGG